MYVCDQSRASLGYIGGVEILVKGGALRGCIQSTHNNFTGDENAPLLHASVLDLGN